MAEGRKFAVFDIDGTLIRWQLYHAIADALSRFGHIPPEAFESIKQARMAWKQRQHPEAFRQYEIRLVKFYDAILKDLNVADFDDAAQAVFDEYKNQVYTYTRDLIAKLKDNGYLLFAISGSQTEVVAKIADYYGFDDYIGTEYLKADGRFSGDSIYNAGDKRRALVSLLKKHGCSKDKSIGVGDSAGDIPMLEEVAEPVAFNPERRLFEHAAELGWKVVLERKNLVYELEKRDGEYQLVKTNG